MDEADPEDFPIPDDALLPDVPIRHLPAARRPQPLTEAEHAELVRADRIKVLGDELYSLALSGDIRDPDRLGHLLPLDALITAWLAGRRSLDTRQAYSSDITLFLRYCLAQTPPINPMQAGWFDLERYVRWLSDDARPAEPWARQGAEREHFSTGTIARRISSLKSFYGFCHDRDQILRDPTNTIGTPRIPEIKRRYLTPAEQDRLYDAADTYPWPRYGRLRQLTWRAIIAIGLDHGWRESEYRTAKIADLVPVWDGENGVWYDGIRRPNMKRGRVQVDVLSDRARNALAEVLRAREIPIVWDTDPTAPAGTALPPAGPLLTFKPNTPPGERWMAMGLETLAIAAGIDPGRDKKNRIDRITFHSLRRASGTNDRDRGMSAEDAAEKLGHASVDTFRRHYDLHRDTPGRSTTVQLGQATPRRWGVAD